MSMSASLVLDSPAATEALAGRLAPHLRAGDTLLLEGPIGAGKTHFARALIGALQRAAGERPEEVPSPSYTLVQTYRAGPLEIRHVDLYRLADPDELGELGLDDERGEPGLDDGTGALSLIEWPERLGERLPPEALTLRLALVEDEGARRLTLVAHGPRGAELAAHARG